MGLPAARVGDPHLCPAATGIVPHTGGPIQEPCWPTVLVCGRPQARILDPAICTGAMDFISQGESSVLVGGLPASRFLHMTSHGGTIMGGCPTVRIGSAEGGGTVTIAVTPATKSVEFVQKLQAQLARLLPTKSGREWMRRMAANGHTVTFFEGKDCEPETHPKYPGLTRSQPGTDSTIEWGPDFAGKGAAGPDSDPGIVLAHEMVHALHNADGVNRNGPDDHYPGMPEGSTASRNEERSTVGTAGPIRLPDGTTEPARDYGLDPPTENSFREDLGKKPRPTYFPPNFQGGPPW